MSKFRCSVCGSYNVTIKLENTAEHYKYYPNVALPTEFRLMFTAFCESCHHWYEYAPIPIPKGKAKS